MSVYEELLKEATVLGGAKRRPSAGKQHTSKETPQDIERWKKAQAAQAAKPAKPAKDPSLSEQAEYIKQLLETIPQK